MPHDGKPRFGRPPVTTYLRGDRLTAAQNAVAPARSLPGFDLVPFGGAGDLAMRELLPALFRRYLTGQFPSHARILGVGRTNIGHDNYVWNGEL